MDTHLRPLSLREILEHVTQLYGSNFLLFAGIAAIYAGSLLGIGLLQIALQELFHLWHLDGRMVWLNLGSAGVEWLLTFLLGGLAVAANNRAVAWVYLGHPATIRSAYRDVLPHLGRYLWLMVIITFVLWAPLGLCYGGFAVIAFFWYRPLLHTAHAQPDQIQQVTVYFGLLALLFAALVIAAVVYEVLMGLRYSLAVPACVVEETGARTALRRSVALSEGSRGRIFVFSVICTVLQFGLSALTQLYFVIAAIHQQNTLPVGQRMAQMLVAFCTGTLLHPIYATGTTLFYYDQHFRKEGFDIKQTLKAPGTEPA